jgi:hypothetical protein
MADSTEVPRRDAARPARLAYLVVRALAGLDPPVVVVPDAESGEVSFDSHSPPADLVVQHLDLRIRLVLLTQAEESEILSNPDSLHTAELLLKHWPETAAVGLVANDSSLSCLILEPFDVEPSVGAPSGVQLPPTPRRDPFPVGDAVRRYLEVVVPDWERVPLSAELSTVGYGDLAPAIASEVRAEISGRRANIDEKRAALDSLNEADARWAAKLVLEASSKDLDAESLAHAVEQRVARRP